MDYMDEGLPYKKKSQAKPPKKSKHKHIYEPCILEFNDLRFSKEYGMVYDVPSARISGYCPVCGKVGSPGEEERWYKTRPYGMGFLSVKTEEHERELNPETRTLPTFWVDDPYFPKYVEVE